MNMGLSENRIRKNPMVYHHVSQSKVVLGVSRFSDRLMTHKGYVANIWCIRVYIYILRYYDLNRSKQGIWVNMGKWDVTFLWPSSYVGDTRGCPMDGTADQTSWDFWRSSASNSIGFCRFSQAFETCSPWRRRVSYGEFALPGSDWMVKNVGRAPLGLSLSWSLLHHVAPCCTMLHHVAPHFPTVGLPSR